MGNERTRLTILIALFACSSVGVHAATRYRASQKHFPDWGAVRYQIGDWTGKDTNFDPVYGTDPADSSLLRVYGRGNSAPIIAYVGFYGDLTGILEVHTPELCYPAQGWAILSTKRSSAGVYRGGTILANQIVVDKGGDRRLVIWWYIAGSRPFTARIRYIYAMLALSTFTGRTDGSMVRLETPIVSEAEAAARNRIDEFRESFLPELDWALPR
jgi:EpsI family protein